MHAPADNFNTVQAFISAVMPNIHGTMAGSSIEVSVDVECGICWPMEKSFLDGSHSRSTCIPSTKVGVVCSLWFRVGVRVYERERERERESERKRVAL